jgi:FeS assembly protein SufD
VVAGDRSQSRIVETYVGPEGTTYFTNAVTEVFAGEDAVVDHYKVQQESLDAFHVASMHLHAARSSNVSSHSFALGGKLVRNDIIALLDGEGAECTLNGLYVADGDRLIDNHTSIDHAKAHCPSHEIYKGILGGKARAVFNGKIIVRQDAQKTDAKQTNRALLLSDGAPINTKPQLEIFADDVKCTHGAAIGQLDEDAIFYLRARGLTYFEARDMLIHAFAGDILNRVRIEPLRLALEEELFQQLAKDLAEVDAA